MVGRHETTPFPRHGPLLGASAFVLLLGLTEFLLKLTGLPFSEALPDALLSALLVLAIFGTVFLLASFVPQRGPLRVLGMAIVHIETAALVAVMFISWATELVLRQPLGGDATRMAMAMPVGITLHLAQSAPLVLAVFAAGLAFSVYLGARALNASAGVRWVVAPSKRFAFCISLAAIASMTGLQLAHANHTRSSYSVFMPGGGNAGPALPGTYSCARAAPVRISDTPPKTGVVNGSPVIVLMIESLRADLLRTDPQAIPFLKELASESMVFDKAYATSTHSDYADLAFWYSRYPLRAETRHGYPANAPWRGLSVFEYFKLHRYDTAYFSSQDERWGDMINWLRIPGVDMYFDSETYGGSTIVDEHDRTGLFMLIRQGIARAGKLEDSQTLALAVKWAQEHGTRPFFLGLNLQNTHFSYVVPPGGPEPFQPAKIGRTSIYGAWSATEAPNMRNRFLNAAYNVDMQLRRFADELKRAGIWDRAIVLVLGDGGEAFFEHGFANHSGPVFDEAVRTLALLKMPKGDPRNGTVFERAVSHVDFVPLLTNVAGMEEWSGFQGHVPWNQPADAPVYMTVNALTREDAVLRWPWKLVRRSFPRASTELYNLADDPAEKHNRIGEPSSVAAKLSLDLASYRNCQLSYYADPRAWGALQPPRYH